MKDCRIINLKPAWGKIEVTRAILKLFEQALQHEDVGRLAIASESCVPVCTFREAADDLWRAERSWLAAYDKPVDAWSFGCVIVCLHHLWTVPFRTSAAEAVLCMRASRTWTKVLTRC